MTVAVITGSAGLIGSQAALHFAGSGFDVVGVDNDMRRVFFGEDSSTAWMVTELERTLGERYRHAAIDIRDRDGIDALFAEYGSDISLVIHTAAQPSHDWAAREPFTDFDVNAVGTLNVLEATRQHCPGAVFIFTSTNKVYGDTPNRLPLVEQDTRWEIDPSHTYAGGIREDMSIDTHAALDLRGVQGRRGRHGAGVRPVLRDEDLGVPRRHAHRTEPCGRGVARLSRLRDAVHDDRHPVPGVRLRRQTGPRRHPFRRSDLVFRPRAARRRVGVERCGEVYNIGGGRFSNCSVLEAIGLCEEIAGRTLEWTYVDDHRIGDHIWWIGDNGRFAEHHPGWELTYDVTAILTEMHHANRDRWRAL